MEKFVDYYGLLGVPWDAPIEAIRAAQRRHQKAWHPDRWVGSSARDRANAHEMAHQLNAAQEALATPRSRAEYDRRWHEHHAGARRSADDNAYESDTDGGSAHAETTDEQSAGVNAALTLPCPHCHTHGDYPDPGGDDLRMTCGACSRQFDARVGYWCLARGDVSRQGGMQYFQTRAARADGTECVIDFLAPASVHLRAPDRFSLVHRRSGEVRFVVNHSLDPPVRWDCAPRRALGGRIGPIQVAIGVALWLIGFLLLAPAVGNLGFIGPVVVACPLLAYLQGRRPIRWLVATLFTAGIATFVVLVPLAERMIRRIDLQLPARIGSTQTGSD